MNTYIKILKCLADNDNGDFIDITHLESNFDFLVEKTQELQKAGKLKIKSTGFYSFADRNNNTLTIGDKSELSKIKAKIVLAGHEYLKENSIEQKPEIKKTLPLEKKIKYISDLISEASHWQNFERGRVDNFVIKAKDIISLVDSSESHFLVEIDIFNNSKNKGVGIISDWQEQIITALERFKIKIESKESEAVLLKDPYINVERIVELKLIANKDFDLRKLIRLCEELNDNWQNNNYYSVITLVRTILNHVPPILKVQNFEQVANNYSGGTSFKKSMGHLFNSSKNIADNHLHSQVEKTEALPNDRQVDFRTDLDFLLCEIVKLTK